MTYAAPTWEFFLTPLVVDLLNKQIKQTNLFIIECLATTFHTSLHLLLGALSRQLTLDKETFKGILHLRKNGLDTISDGCIHLWTYKRRALRTILTSLGLRGYSIHIEQPTLHHAPPWLSQTTLRPTPLEGLISYSFQDLYIFISTSLTPHTNAFYWQAQWGAMAFSLCLKDRGIFDSAKLTLQEIKEDPSIALN